MTNTIFIDESRFHFTKLTAASNTFLMKHSDTWLFKIVKRKYRNAVIGKIKNAFNWPDYWSK